MAASYLILTDSGGIQEEAPILGKPVLVLRQRTERVEGVEAGVARLVGTETDVILSETQRLLDDEALYEQMSRPLTLYGDGQAASRIAAWLRHLASLSVERPDAFTAASLEPAILGNGNA
jgi:UDP-N-acetylglucosamine 2-epimerase (non-hydrolysing)